MINFHLPADSSGVYGVVFDCIVGPISASESSKDQVIGLTLDQDHLDQGVGSTYGEKAVYHEKVDGDVYHAPYFNDITYSPSSTFPQMSSWNCKTFPAGGLTSALLLYGASRYGTQVQTGAVQHYCWTGGGTNLQRYFINISKSTPDVISTITRVDIKDIAYSNGRITYQFRSVPYDVPLIPAYHTGQNWTLTKSSGAMLEMVSKFKEKAASGWSSSSGSALQPRTVSVASPSLARLQMGALAASKLNPVDLPTGDADYGDLAMKATANANANQVNMIAFLRDLRNPLALIPKLKNFWKLKTLAGNYLVFDYGILPTIDDIKSIVRACQRIKPYVDKNGFKTYTASATSTASGNEVSHDIVQRVKVAISNEDYGLGMIANKIDSMGFLLTFENVWDLIPYSFVLDWFVDIGSFLERIDANLRIIRLPIRYATMSRKITTRVHLNPSRESPYSGTLEKVRYHRWVTDHCPVPNLSVSAQTDFNHWVEASALIIQRKKN